MKLVYGLQVALIAVLFVYTSVAQEESAQSEHPQIAESSSEFVDTLTATINALKKQKFSDGLETPGFGAISNQEFRERIKLINEEPEIDGVGVGVRGVKYDVILQPGHYHRRTGKTGTTGALVSERALAAYITNITAKHLKQYGDKVLVIDADHYITPTSHSDFDGLTSSVFLSIHFDDSPNHCHGKASLAYPKGIMPYTMHVVGWSLADALGYRYEEFARDNYTPNEAGYYMFSKIQTERLSGLLEVGELTCEAKEKVFITSADEIGDNLAYALNVIIKAPAHGLEK